MNGAGRDSVTLLGVKGGPAIRPGSAMPTATLLRMGGQTVLVDAGLGASAALCRAGVALTELDAVLITHLHSDHYLELGPLLHTAWTAGLTRPLPVHGPAGLTAYWQGFLAAMADDIDTRIADEGRPGLAGLAALRPLGEGDAVTLGALRVTALRNHHPPVTESYALRVEAADTSVVLSGDTAPMEAMAAFARGADLLVHEAMLPGAVDALARRVGHADHRLRDHILRSHTPADAAAKIAARAGVAQLALNHLIPSDDPAVTEADWTTAAAPHFDGPLHVGRDGMEIAL
jgi:ribonuclease BN (tRNA processing enzyme)